MDEDNEPVSDKHISVYHEVLYFKFENNSYN